MRSDYPNSDSSPVPLLSRDFAMSTCTPTHSPVTTQSVCVRGVECYLLLANLHRNHVLESAFLRSEVWPERSEREMSNGA